MRKLSNWLESWLEYSSPLESPERMRLWAGISAISAALQRKAWTFVKAQQCYANMYVLLCGPPGVGKGNAMKPLIPWLREIETLHIAPDGLTQRSFYSALENSRVEDATFKEGDNAIEVLDKAHYSMSAFVEELGVFLPPGDNKFIYFLCHAYDCPPRFHYKTEHAGENLVNNAWFSMVSAVTPKALKDIFTEQAMELGISARTVIIFSDEKIDVEIFGVPAEREQLRKDLQFDLRRIACINGEYQFTNEAAEELVAWSKTDFAPIPKDPRFEHYNSRRFVQIVKLCMVCAASKRQDTIILPEDLFMTKSFILEAEREMPKAIAALGANPFLAQQQVAMQFVNDVWAKGGGGTPEGVLRQRLSTDLDPRYADMIMDDLAKARWLVYIGESPNRVFFPRGKVDVEKLKDVED